jgi:glycerate kinase
VRILLAPASFKGSLSATAAAAAMAAGIRRAWPDVEIRELPMADGGEGTLDAVLAASGGRRHTTVVHGAGQEKIEAAYGVLDASQGSIAVLEVAQIVGLVAAGATPVESRTTRGIGELLRLCLAQGLRHFLIGLGGSSTNDGGAGTLAALGVKLLDAKGNAIHPTPQGLANLDRLDFSELDPRLLESEITLLTDVTNPLCGTQGATAIYGPQKGVSPSQVPLFEAHLRHLAELGDAWFASALSQCPGTGAAGGLGYALRLLGASNRSGAQAVAELIGLEGATQWADWVITGEGRSDMQTLQGKAPQLVAALAKCHGVPVTLLSGAIDIASRNQLNQHFDGCFAATPETIPLRQAMAGGAALLETAAEKLAVCRQAQ